MTREGIISKEIENENIQEQYAREMEMLQRENQSLKSSLTRKLMRCMDIVYGICASLRVQVDYFERSSDPSNLKQLKTNPQQQWPRAKQ